MGFYRFTPIGLVSLLGACMLAPPPPPAAEPAKIEVVTTVTDARLAFISITGELPAAGETDYMPPDLFDPLMDRVPVLLDLTIRPPLEIAVADADGLYGPLQDCSFGPVEAGEISVPTGSNHMLMSVRLGTPADHPENLLSCEYDPSEMTDESPGEVVHVRGCFLPQSVSIPTAVQWVLNPLPASACGLGD